MPTAILVSEIGSGLGHLTRLVRVVANLKSGGWVTHVVTAEAVQAERPSSTKLLPDLVPSLPIANHCDVSQVLKPSRRNALSFAGILYSAGFHVKQNAISRIEFWHDIISKHAPDILIADNAPMAVIAAYGRIPSVVVGNGFHVPAISDGVLSPDGGAPEPDDLELQSKIFTTLNEALSICGRKNQFDIAKVLCGDMSCPSTLPQLDPRFSIREGALVPPEVDTIPTIAREAGSEVLAYVGFELEEHWAGICAFASVGIPVRLFVPKKIQRHFSIPNMPGVMVQTEPFTANDISTRARLILHHGGSGITHLAAYSGVPQFIICLHNERRWNAHIVKRMGAGEFVLTDTSGDQVKSLAKAVLNGRHYKDNALGWAENAHLWANGNRGQDLISDRIQNLI